MNDRSRLNQFIDDAAELSEDEDYTAEDADEDEEELAAEEDAAAAAADESADIIARSDEEEGDEEDDENRADKRRKKVHKRSFEEDETLHMSFDQQREQEETDRIVAGIEDRYRQHAGEDGDEEIDLDNLADDWEDEDTTASSALLPSIRDPKLFLIRCDPGKEQEMLLKLLSRSYTHAANPTDPIFIHSAFTTPASRGYIYIEAEKEIHVKRAIRGLRELKWWKILLLPITQMVNAVSFADENVNLKERQWIRIKSGLYKGDLGQISRLNEQGYMASVKLIPRIDFVALDEEKATGKKRKRAAFGGWSGAVRPAQAWFRPNEIKKKYGAEVGRHVSKGIGDGKHYWLYAGNDYRNGYLYKTMRVSGLVTEHVNPTSDEIEKFKSHPRHEGGGDDDDEEEEESEGEEDSNGHSAAGHTEGTGRTLFTPGDRVIVSEGELKNITGRIISLDKSHLIIQPDPHQPINMQLTLMTKQVKKYFRLGDHVKVLSGQYKDETGMITQVLLNSDMLTIYSDTSQREISVMSGEVMESSEVSSGRESLGSYELYDLVQLNGDNVGVVVKVEIAALKLLTHKDTVVSVRLQEIGKKRSSKHAAALDQQSNQLVVDDVVNVTSGTYKGRQGTIKHIYRHFLFLFSRTHPENNGLFVATAKQVTIVGQPVKSLAQQTFAPRSPYIGAGDGATSENKSSRPNQRFTPLLNRSQRDPLIGTSVTITSGPYKSFIGNVVEATELHVKVELQALARKVMFSRNEIAARTNISRDSSSLIGNGPRREERFLGSQTPLLGSRTPAYEYGSQTPARDIGSMTPHHSSSETPSRDIWTANTPAHDSNEEEEREEEQEEWQQDYATTHTPVQTPHTPATPNIRTPVTANADGNDEEDQNDEIDHDSRTTPHTPITPNRNPRTPLTGAPTTPSTHTPVTNVDDDYPSSSLDDNGEGIASELTLPPGARVQVSFDDGSIEEGHIISRSDLSYRVQLLDSEGRVSRTVEVSGATLVPVQPDKNQHLIVLSGSSAGKVGTLLNINHEEGIVNMSGDIVILAMNTLCRYDKPK